MAATFEKANTYVFAAPIIRDREVGGLFNARVNFTIYKPDGSSSRQVKFGKKVSCGRSSLFGRTFEPEGLGAYALQIREKGSSREYKVKGKVADLNADISFEIELDFYLK